MDVLKIIEEFLVIFPRRCRSCKAPAEREGLYTTVYLVPFYVCDRCEPPPLVLVQDSAYASLLRAAKKFVANS